MLDILNYEGGSQPPKKDFVYEPNEGYVRLLQIRDFGEKPFPTYVPKNSRLKTATADDLLLARYGGSSGSDSLGRICSGLEGAYNVALAKLVFDRKLLETDFVRALFMGPWFRAKVSQNSRSCQTGFNRDDVEDIWFPLAPLAEQRRIVGKLELLLGKVSSSQQRLSRVPGLLKRFRQSVLAAACSGKLTADWREQNDCGEPASGLITRLGSERRERYRELCVAAKNAKRSKPQEFDNIEPSVRTDLDTFDLPSDWSWVDLRCVMTVDEPFCYGVVQPGANEPNGNLLVRAGDLQNGTVNLSELRRIPADIDAEYERSRLKGEELLVTVVGAGIGTVAVAPASCAGFNIARAVAKVPIRDVSAKYVFQWFNTSKALSWMVGDAREVARPTLNLEQLRTILVPLTSHETRHLDLLEASILGNGVERSAIRHDRSTQGTLKRGRFGLFGRVQHAEHLPPSLDREPADLLPQALQDRTHAATRPRMLCRPSRNRRGLVQLAHPSIACEQPQWRPAPKSGRVQTRPARPAFGRPISPPP